MRYRPQESVFDKFFNNRKALIYQFRKGDITKREFIEAHYAFIQRLNLKPFKYRIDSFEKGLYNYQYYNMMAKYSYMKSKDAKLQKKHPKIAMQLQQDAQYYYKQKDKTIIKLLTYLDFVNVEAYYIKVKSPMLKNKLFEVVLKDYDDVVFHSISQWVVDRLREEGVFDEQKKKSMIDKYINEKY
ncbi:hypothetical protein QBE52_12380 [Clostridiaceae bacterium 35-E11]